MGRLMEHLHKQFLIPISKAEAEALLKAHNCTRNAWGDCDSWIAREGAVTKEIVLQELKTKRWFKPKR